MIGSLRTLMSGHLFGGMLLALLVSLLINVVATHKAMAGFAPILIGRTIVMSGTDRVTGKVYNVAKPTIKNLLNGTALQPYISAPSVIRVYKGDTVQFAQVTQGVDPLNIGGLSFLQIHYKGFNDTINPLNLAEYSGFLPKILGGKGPNIVWDNNGWPVYFVFASASFSVAPPVTIGSGIAGPGSDDPGKQFCEFVSTNPTIQFYVPPFVYPYVEWKIPSLADFTIGGLTINIGRTMSCAEIAYVYNLQPSLTLNNGGGSGGSVNITTSLSQGALPSGAPGATYSKKTQWQVSQFFLPLGTTVPGSTTSKSQSPCSYFRTNYGDKNMGCIIPKLSDKKTDARSGSSLFNRINTVFNKDGSFKSGTALPSALAPPEDVPEGYKVCYALSVSKYKPYLDTLDAGWRNSKVVCTAGSKKPKVQILGDDIRVGGTIETSTTDISDKKFGSWGQYASYSFESTINFATQSGFDGGVPSSANWSKLTFANVGNVGSAHGHFFATKTDARSQGAAQTEPFFKERAKSGAGIGDPLNLSGKSNKTPYLVTSNSLTINGGNIGKGETVIIVASDATVKITGDIKYTSSALSSVDDIPQVVIIAKNINIDPNVRRIDAWLVASGTINTCFPTPAKLTIADCLNPLRFNGPLATGKILLNRTYGSTGNDPGEPAEIFNNNGTSYLWAENYLRNNKSLSSILQKELPPRF